MPKYGRITYGRLNKYGKYQITTRDEQALGPHVRYRMRSRSKDGTLSDYLTMCEDRVSMPGKDIRIRMRTDDNDWAYVQRETIQGDVVKVRMRSIDSEKRESEWVESDRANLKLI